MKCISVKLLMGLCAPVDELRAKIQQTTSGMHNKLPVVPVIKADSGAIKRNFIHKTAVNDYHKVTEYVHETAEKSIQYP